MFIYGGIKWCTGGTKHRINGTQAVKYSDKNEIILIYREVNLKEYLFKDEVKTYLKELGYKRCDLNYVLRKLTKRFSSFYLKKSTFPHELGIILNYPIEDIKGFI